MSGAGSKIGGLLWWASLACLVGGGVLWALSPVGVELSELKFKTPDVFWKLFPTAPLLLAVGVLGLLLMRREGRSLAAVDRCGRGCGRHECPLRETPLSCFSAPVTQPSAPGAAW